MQNEKRQIQVLPVPTLSTVETAHPGVRDLNSQCWWENTKVAVVSVLTVTTVVLMCVCCVVAACLTLITKMIEWPFVIARRIVASRRSSYR